MAKSDVGLPAKSGATQQCVSEEERILRWKWMCGEFPGMSAKELLKKVYKVRKETKKP